MIAKRILGAVSLLMGAALLVWFTYNLFRPTADFKANFRSGFQVILPLAMLWYGWRWLNDGGPGIETLQIDPQAPELVASVREARRTMPAFLEAVQRHADQTYLKFPLTTDAGVTEHIWAYVHHYADGVFNVSLSNTPYTQTAAIENRRDIREGDVEDWQILLPNGSIQGGYSLRALFDHVERKGIRLNKTMRKQRAQFLDAAARQSDVAEAPLRG
jgi:uncharacterized protein YegJ (DUF2314 family)